MMLGRGGASSITRFLIKCCCRLRDFLRLRFKSCLSCFLPSFFLCRKGHPIVSLFNQKNLSLKFSAAELLDSSSDRSEAREL